MRRLLPITEIEKKMMCMGAVFIEENHVLDDLFEIVGSDIGVDGSANLAPDIKEQVLEEVAQYFFRLDMNWGPEIKSDCLEILQEFWQVTHRASALQALESIRQQGHRTKFQVLKKTLPHDGVIDGHSLEKFKQIFNFDFADPEKIQLSDEDYMKLASWIQRTNKFIAKMGILGWDMARYVHLIRLCYISEYLTDIEAWEHIAKAESLVTGKFSTWTEFAQSFLIGRTFWSGGEDPQLKLICERLAGHPASPWNFWQP